MKKIICTSIWVFCTCVSIAQQSSSVSNLPIGVLLKETNAQLNGKLTALATQGGFSSASPFSRFILTAEMIETNKEIASSAPPMILLEELITLCVVDNYEQKIINSIQVPIKGVGKNEQKALSKAVNSISLKNTEIADFLTVSRTRILDYFNNNCQQIIDQANSKAGAKNYDEALMILSGIPMECKDCYTQSQKVSTSIVKKKIDYDCKTYLKQAETLWNANQTLEAANEVAGYLNEIDANAACMNEVNVFSNQVRTDVKRTLDQNWDFKMKMADSAIDLQKREIEMAKEIGVAYGTNQPDKEVDIDWVFR